jgi:hypothetical protein
MCFSTTAVFFLRYLSLGGRLAHKVTAMLVLQQAGCGGKMQSYIDCILNSLHEFLNLSTREKNIIV